MQGFKKFMLIFGLFLLLAVGGVTAYFYYGSYSDGYRVGTLLKLSRKGMLFKTWEGELSQGFLEQNIQDGGVATKVWPFSVASSDQKTVQDLQGAMDHGSRVKLHYAEKYFIIPWLGDTKYVVDRVEVVQ